MVEVHGSVLAETKFLVPKIVLGQGRSQKCVLEGTKQGDWGQKSPSGVQRQNPGGDLGAKPQKLKIYVLITIAIMC